MDINSPEFTKQLIGVIDARIKEKLKEFTDNLSLEKIGKVATSGDGAIIQVYINNSTTAVEIKNPRSFSLPAGQLVVVVFPNFKNDNSKYIDRIL